MVGTSSLCSPHSRWWFLCEVHFVRTEWYGERHMKMSFQCFPEHKSFPNIPQSNNFIRWTRCCILWIRREWNTADSFHMSLEYIMDALITHNTLYTYYITISWHVILTVIGTSNTKWRPFKQTKNYSTIHYILQMYILLRSGHSILSVRGIWNRVDCITILNLFNACFLWFVSIVLDICQSTKSSCIMTCDDWPILHEWKEWHINVRCALW